MWYMDLVIVMEAHGSAGSGMRMHRAKDVKKGRWNETRIGHMSIKFKVRQTPVDWPASQARRQRSPSTVRLKLEA